MIKIPNLFIYMNEESKGKSDEGRELFWPVMQFSLVNFFHLDLKNHRLGELYMSIPY